MTVSLVDQQLTHRVAFALGRIARCRDAGERVIIDLPVLYPSGSTVVVEIEQNGDKIWVSDMGLGHTEAELMHATDSYKRLAGQKAKEFGVDYDGQSMFALWVPVSRIEAAIVCVANASAQAAADAVRHASEAHNRGQDEAFFERVLAIFGKKSVARTAEISGQRTSWEAHNVVVFPHGKRAIFEPMSKHPTSVSSKFLMFSDIKATNTQISLNVVVSNIGCLDAKAQMVADLANIVPIDAPDTALRDFAEAS